MGKCTPCTILKSIVFQQIIFQKSIELGIPGDIFFLWTPLLVGTYDKDTWILEFPNHSIHWFLVMHFTSEVSLLTFQCKMTISNQHFWMLQIKKWFIKLKRIRGAPPLFLRMPS